MSLDKKPGRVIIRFGPDLRVVDFINSKDWQRAMNHVGHDWIVTFGPGIVILTAPKAGPR